jgi:death on curing protein
VSIEYLRIESLVAYIEAKGWVIADFGRLDSAATRPRAGYGDYEAYPTIALRAAALLHSVVCDHALVDGNERLGVIALLAFLDLNNRELDLTEDQFYDLVMDIAVGRERDVQVIAQRLNILPSSVELEEQAPTRSVGRHPPPAPRSGD